ncbi:MAG: tripartite tricarboxylate transporter substrate binding protein [Burkholderiales bacterium]|nr:tripartite tricarboxylate transporter substrate binding protein [Burkholderiales bacterium]
MTKFACLYGTLLSLLLAGASGPSGAQWRPEQNIEIVAGTNPGGAADLTARTVQKLLQERKFPDLPLAVINKPGAGGAIGWAYINQHAGNPHYLAVSTPPLLTNHITGKSKTHHSDLTPVALLFGEHFPFVVRSDSPIRTGKDLIEKLRADPGSIAIAVASSGGANHIAVALVAKSAGVDVRKLKVVVYNSGGDTLTALLGGHVQLVAANPSSAARLVKAGQARAIAVAATQRLLSPFADVPTWREQGVDAVLMTWRGIVAPKGIPPAAVSYWEHGLRQMTESAEWKENLQRNLWDDIYLDAAGARKFLDAEYGQLKSALIDLGLAR